MFKTLTDGCEPTRGSKFSACVDLYASESIIIGAGETELVGLGIAIDIDFNWINRKFNHFADEKKEEYKEWFSSSHYLQLMLRSSLGKKGLILPNGVGVIDMDYKDEIKMIIHNPIHNKCFDNYGAFYADNQRGHFVGIKKGDIFRNEYGSFGRYVCDGFSP